MSNGSTQITCGSTVAYVTGCQSCCTGPIFHCTRESTPDSYSPGYPGTPFAFSLDSLGNFLFYPAGKFEEDADGSARLVGSVYLAGSPSKVFQVTLSFFGAMSSGSARTGLRSQAYIAGGGPVDPTSWHFYSDVAGYLTGAGDYTGALIKITKKSGLFQIGVGASDRDVVLGASGLLNFQVLTAPLLGQVSGISWAGGSGGSGSSGSSGFTSSSFPAYGSGVLAMDFPACQSASTPNGHAPRLWMLSSDNAHLVATLDYTTPLSTSTDYGAIKYQDTDGTLKTLATSGAFAVDKDGTAYLAVNQSVAGVNPPVLLALSLSSVLSSGSTVASVVGHIQTALTPAVNESSVAVTGLGFDPADSNLYVSTVGVVRLSVINKYSGTLVSARGTITANGSLSVSTPQDLKFGPAGNIMVADGVDDYVYVLDKNSSGIIGRIGTGQASKLDAVVYDQVNSTLLGYDNDAAHSFVVINSVQGQSLLVAPLGTLGLGSLAGMDFW